MQTLQQQQIIKVKEVERKNILLEIVSDKYCRTILESIMKMPKSVIEIMAETKIPMSTTYRRNQSLHDNKLVATSGIITSKGKKLFLYKSKIKGIQSRFDDDRIEVELVIIR